MWIVPKSKKRAASLLTVRGMTRRFGDRTILSDVDLDVSAGEAVGVVGPNGSGKSTLLRCIVGSDEADAGEATLAGRALDERLPEIRRDLAVVMDDIDFFPDLSVVEHLDLMARAHAQPDAEEIVNGVLDEVGLMEVSGQLPSTLSSGQRRRLALASAFVRPRLLVVLDEPEARLDVDGVRWLGEKLLAEKKAGRGVLLVSHDPDLVARVCDRVVRLGQDPDTRDDRD
jgi:ABC-2 type transport system ATP-binding protein